MANVSLLSFTFCKNIRICACMRARMCGHQGFTGVNAGTYIHRDTASDMLLSNSHFRTLLHMSHGLKTGYVTLNKGNDKLPCIELGIYVYLELQIIMSH